MRRNTFNDPYLNKDDDFVVCWMEAFGDDEPDKPLARFLEDDNAGTDEDPSWGCEITDNSDRTVYVENFATRDDLVAWLESWNVEIEG